MAWYENVPKVVGALVPDLDADPKHQLRWRWSVFGAVIGLALVQGVHTLIACGWLATWGISGFAYASDVQEVNDRTRRTEIRQIEGQLLSSEMAYCSARRCGKPTLYIYQRILASMADYEAVSGKVWRRPGCEELGE